jgi:hypothetical protein
MCHCSMYPCRTIHNIRKEIITLKTRDFKKKKKKSYFYILDLHLRFKIDIHLSQEIINYDYVMRCTWIDLKILYNNSAYNIVCFWKTINQIK